MVSWKRLEKPVNELSEKADFSIVLRCEFITLRRVTMLVVNTMGSGE